MLVVIFDFIKTVDASVYSAIAAFLNVIIAYSLSKISNKQYLINIGLQESKDYILLYEIRLKINECEVNKLNALKGVEEKYNEMLACLKEDYLNIIEILCKKFFDKKLDKKILLICIKTIL